MTDSGKDGEGTDVDDLASAIREFEAALPGWWWSIGACSTSRDASCGPDAAGPDCLLLQDPKFDQGFHCDNANGTVASSLRDVMRQALAAKRGIFTALIDATDAAFSLYRDSGKDTR